MHLTVKTDPIVLRAPRRTMIPGARFLMLELIMPPPLPRCNAQTHGLCVCCALCRSLSIRAGPESDRRRSFPRACRPGTPAPAPLPPAPRAGCGPSPPGAGRDPSSGPADAASTQAGPAQHAQPPRGGWGPSSASWRQCRRSAAPSTDHWTAALVWIPSCGKGRLLGLCGVTIGV